MKAVSSFILLVGCLPATESLSTLVRVVTTCIGSSTAGCSTGVGAPCLDSSLNLSESEELVVTFVVSQP